MERSIQRHLSGLSVSNAVRVLEVVSNALDRPGGRSKIPETVRYQDGIIEE